jgi:hypothetical protein
MMPVDEKRRGCEFLGEERNVKFSWYLASVVNLDFGLGLIRGRSWSKLLALIKSWRLNFCYVESVKKRSGDLACFFLRSNTREMMSVSKISGVVVVGASCLMVWGS